MSVVPSQILYLEHGSSRLYAEAIQVISTRHLCWSRPTLLIQGLPENGPVQRQEAIAEAARCPENAPLKLYDLEDAPDLIWPLTPFQIAYDLDFFSLLVQLKMNPDRLGQASGKENGKKQLSRFIQRFWQAHPDIVPTAAKEAVAAN